MDTRTLQHVSPCGDQVGKVTREDSPTSDDINITPRDACIGFCGNIDGFVSLFIIFLCWFLTFIAGLYAVGQITQLELSNYFCPKKSLSEIREHSIEFGLNHGTDEGCWKTKRFAVEYHILKILIPIIYFKMNFFNHTGDPNSNMYMLYTYQ